MPATCGDAIDVPLATAVAVLLPIHADVLMEGTPREVVANQDVRRVYLGERFSL